MSHTLECVVREQLDVASLGSHEMRVGHGICRVRVPFSPRLATTIVTFEGFDPHGTDEERVHLLSNLLPIFREGPREGVGAAEVSMLLPQKQQEAEQVVGSSQRRRQ